MFEQISHLLEAELTREKPLSQQTIDHLNKTYNTDLDHLPDFFAMKLPLLEPYEVDLAFCFMFTPLLEEQTPFAGLLRDQALREEEIERLVKDLAAKKLVASYRQDRNLFKMVLQEVSIQRYVSLLNLGHPISQEAVALIEKGLPAKEHARAFAILRSPVWQTEPRRNILLAFLNAFIRRETYSQEKLQYLTEFTYTFRPRDIQDFDRLLVNLIDSYKTEETHRFYNEQLEQIYGAEGGLRPNDDLLLKERKKNIELAGLLREDMNFILQDMPEFVKP